MDLDILVENQIDMQPEIVPGSAGVGRDYLGEGKWLITSIDLVPGYHKADNPPLLKTFLSPVDDMIGHVAKSFRKS
jgi:hypothetical protein